MGKIPRPVLIGGIVAVVLAIAFFVWTRWKHRVRAALTGDRQEAYYAAQLDPLTAASVTLPKIRAMVDELIQAENQFMPTFR